MKSHLMLSLNAKEIMIYWTIRLIKAKGWQPIESTASAEADLPKKNRI